MGFIRWFTVGGFQPAVLRSEVRFGTQPFEHAACESSGRPVVRLESSGMYPGRFIITAFRGGPNEHIFILGTSSLRCSPLPHP